MGDYVFGWDIGWADDGAVDIVEIVSEEVCAVERESLANGMTRVSVPAHKAIVRDKTGREREVWLMAQFGYQWEMTA
jgi:hypothetical protein